MKKRIVAILLLLVLLLPETGLAAVKGVLNQQMSTRSGPGTKYTEELGTLPVDTSITVISQIETAGTVWYQVEFRYNSQLHRAYTGKKRVNVSDTNIPWENAKYVEDVTTATAEAYYGPGTQYALRRGKVSAKTTVRVFGVEGDWALCEYRENNKWARGYIHVDQLKNTVGVPVTPSPVPPTPAPAPTRRPANNIVDPVGCWCIDYYGEPFNYAGRSEDYVVMVGLLPVLTKISFDGVPCIRSHTYVYSGPGEHYWRRYNPGSGYAYTGTLDTNLRIFGQQNGWIMIRYPSDANGGYRYGWVIPAAISIENQNKTPNIIFAQGLRAVVTRYTTATDDPDRSLQNGGTAIDENVIVTPLAFLDDRRNWVYCEYQLREGNNVYTARGFLPADSLRIL